MFNLKKSLFDLIFRTNPVAAGDYLRSQQIPASPTPTTPPLLKAPSSSKMKRYKAILPDGREAFCKGITKSEARSVLKTLFGKIPPHTVLTIID